MDLGFYETQFADLLQHERARKKKQQPRSGIGPTDVLRAIETVLPAWMRTSKIWPSWRGIGAYAREMVKRSETYKNPTAGHQLYIAGQDILGLLPRFWRRRREASVSSDWDFCPLCWRPVLAQSHAQRPEPCSLHKTRSPEYQKLDRQLRRLGYSRRKSLLGKLSADRLPPTYAMPVRQLLTLGIEKEEDLKLSWDLFPCTRDQLGTLEADLTDIQGCFATLAQPEALPLDDPLLGIPLAFSNRLPTLWELLYRPMLIRTEAWLRLIAEIKGVVRKDGTLSLQRGRPRLA